MPYLYISCLLRNAPSSTTLTCCYACCPALYIVKMTDDNWHEVEAMCHRGRRFFTTIGIRVVAYAHGHQTSATSLNGESYLLQTL